VPGLKDGSYVYYIKKKIIFYLRKKGKTEVEKLLNEPGTLRLIGA